MNEIALTIFKGIIDGFLAIWFVWASLLVLAIGKLLYRAWDMKRLADSGINDIDKMDGKTFEKYLEVLFKKLGYRVERTRYVGDYGADLVVWKDGIKTVIQAKRHKKNVGIKAIQEAVAAKGYYSCEKAMVVTNSAYTRQAIELARANDVQLWDRKDLLKALSSAKNTKAAEPITHIGNSNDTFSEAAISIEEEVAPNNICVVCGEEVSEKVRQYCVTHSERFDGKIYCYQHQRGVK